MKKLLCHGWRIFDEANISVAFIMLELRRPPLVDDEQFDNPAPTEEDLLEPGGSSPEALSRFNPQRADGVYNEFDFTGASSKADPVTLSYGEHISISRSVDFEEFVRRAEKQAALSRFSSRSR